jgi:DNA-directed RNA polymerase subunit N (RpoN/RPB10)
MIIFITSIIPVLFVVYYIFLFRKRKSIEFEIGVGMNCYSCGTVLKTKSDYYRELINSGSLKNNNYTLCVSCHRNDIINKLINSLKYKIFVNTNKFVLSKRSFLLSRIFLYVMMCLSVIYLMLSIWGIINHHLILISNILSFIFWVYMLYRFKISSIKKPAN